MIWRHVKAVLIMPPIGLAAAIWCFIAPISADAQQDLDQQIQQWQDLPEDPGMREVCANDLKWSEALADANNHGATVTTLLRWAEQQSELTANQSPDQTLAIGTNLILLNYIQRLNFDREIYSRLPGGFSQWAYESCLKGKPLYEK